MRPIPRDSLNAYLAPFPLGGPCQVDGSFPFAGVNAGGWEQVPGTHLADLRRVAGTQLAYLSMCL